MAQGWQEQLNYEISVEKNELNQITWMPNSLTFEPLQQFWINLPANWGEPNAKWLVRKFKNLTLLNIVKEPASCSLLLSTLFVNMAHRNNISKTNRKFVEDFYGDDPLQFIIKVFLQKTAEFKWWDFKQICKKMMPIPAYFSLNFIISTIVDSKVQFLSMTGFKLWTSGTEAIVLPTKLQPLP